MTIVTRLAGITSISLLTAAFVFSTASADSNSVTESSPGSPVQSTEGVEIAVLNDYPTEQKVVSAQVKTASLHPEYRRAISNDAQDLKGYEKSLYRGKYYHKDQERFRKCVMDRESSFSYRAANRSSSARGAYQFLDNNWRDGLVHMMLKESKKKDHNLEKKMKKLFNKPIHKWNRYFQDRAFFTALNYNGKWSGKKHWNATVPGTGC